MSVWIRNRDSFVLNPDVEPLVNRVKYLPLLLDDVFHDRKPRFLVLVIRKRNHDIHAFGFEGGDEYIHVDARMNEDNTRLTPHVSTDKLDVFNYYSIKQIVGRSPQAHNFIFIFINLIPNKESVYYISHNKPLINTPLYVNEFMHVVTWPLCFDVYFAPPRRIVNIDRPENCMFKKKQAAPGVIFLSPANKSINGETTLNKQYLANTLLFFND
jgi:hypothetical protein